MQVIMFIITWIQLAINSSFILYSEIYHDIKFYFIHDNLPW